MLEKAINGEDLKVELIGHSYTSFFIWSFKRIDLGQISFSRKEDGKNLIETLLVIFS